MKILVLFCLTTVVATGAMLAAVTMKNPAIGIGVAIAVIMLFARFLSGRAKRISAQKQKERLFYQYFISQQGRRSY